MLSFCDRFIEKGRLKKMNVRKGRVVTCMLFCIHFSCVFRQSNTSMHYAYIIMPKTNHPKNIFPIYQTSIFQVPRNRTVWWYNTKSYFYSQR